MADPNRSRVLLIHPDRCFIGEADGGSRDWRAGVSLLAAARAMFGISPVLVGERDTAAKVMQSTGDRCSVLDIDALMMWQPGELPSASNMQDTGVMFMAGAWLEEDVLLAAIRAAGLGYDVRLLADLSRLRRESERELVVGRAAMHGILMVTLRQALLEWAAFSGDTATLAQVRALLA